jgi:nucleoside-triphosphatase
MSKGAMNKNILLTGRPGCGKTTLIQRVIAQLNTPLGGFYTQEMRVGGAREGFKMIAFDGQEGILAHVKFPGPPRVGRYGVNLDALAAVGVASIQRALQRDALIVIDEIGPMELFSAAFCQGVTAALDSINPVFGSVVWRSRPFSDQVKARPDVTVIEVNAGNRDQLAAEVLTLLQAVIGRDAD